MARARLDESVVAAAVVGSAALGSEDRWSDIDLALRLREPVDLGAVADAWTAWLVADHDVVDHTDVWAGPVLYRVFLTRSSLQVDVSFWPHHDFGARGPGFRLLFGEQARSQPAPVADDESVVGMAWLYALHVRSALARGRVHQAVHHLDGLRDRVVVLACLRSGVSASYGRGADDLDADLLQRLTLARAAALDHTALQRSLSLLLDLLLVEVEHLDPERAQRLRAPLDAMRAGR